MSTDRARSTGPANRFSCVADPGLDKVLIDHFDPGHVYGSNRGHDRMAIFTIDAATGKVTAAGHQCTGGKTPRDSAVGPVGK